MWRRVMAVVLTLWCAAMLTAAPAVADTPPDTSTGGQARTLPNRFPADLKQFVGTTDEFKSAPWFSGPCKDHGGDFGAFANASMAVEDRLIYWTANDVQKKAMLESAVLKTTAGQPSVLPEAVSAYIDQGVEPPHELLPRVFPAGDATYSLRSPVCADDLKRWSSTAWNTWGFQWASKPDRQSLADLKTLAGWDRLRAESCPASIVCAHAFWVNCDQADPAPDDLRRCVAWNRAVGQLMVGTAQWVDQNTTFADRMKKLLDSTIGPLTTAIVKAWEISIKADVELIRFVADPQTVVDEWANAAKESAADLCGRVLTGMTHVGAFDPTSRWFLRWYAYSTGIGVVVMGLMTILALWRSAAKGETIKTIAGDLLGYGPAGVVMMLFAPMLADMLLGLSNLMSEAIARVSGPDMSAMVDNVVAFTDKLNAPMLAGGPVVGLILFILLIAGLLGVFFGLLVHANGLPLLAVAAGIGFGMWVHPKWRPKALRPVLVFIGTVFSKPLLFLLLGVQTSLINATLTTDTDPSTGGDIGVLTQLSMVTVAFIVVGLAPWSMLKYAPLLPTRSDSAGFANSGSMLAGTLGGAGSNAMMARGFRRGYRERDGGGSSSSRDEGGKAGSGGAAAGGSSAGGVRSGDPGPTWRATDGSGRSSTEARFGDGLARRAGGGDAAEAAAKKAGTAGKLAKGAGSAAMGVVAAGLPIAAQASAAALNKARATAESAPGEAEMQQ
ncbi:hypothetical protein ACFXG4_30415 [Nocardia sp. NPDC059246]|uniref:hypothetical protein n=1 Tax=unclassified Nocardia TaxID=2637762 RepID=UPI00367BEDF8